MSEEIEERIFQLATQLSAESRGRVISRLLGFGQSVLICSLGDVQHLARTIVTTLSRDDFYQLLHLLVDEIPFTR